jgi:hypothetical protein
MEKPRERTDLEKLKLDWLKINTFIDDNNKRETLHEQFYESLD